MAENKQSFVAYCEWMETFNKLTDEQAGVLIKHVFAYVNDQNPEPKDFIIDLAFTPIKQQLKRDLKKYESIVERNKINGSKGGRPKKEETQKTQSVISDNLGNPKKPKKADNGNDDDNVDVNETKNIPDFSEFLQYALLSRPRVDQLHLKAKYEAWVQNNWRDGNDKEIKNWKTKLNNTLPYLKDTDRVQAVHNGQRYDHTRYKEHETYMDRVKRNKIDPRDTEALKVFVEEEDKHPTTVIIIQDRFKTNPEEFPYVKD